MSTPEQVAARPDEPYIIARYGGYFRPDAEGYTRNIAEAGLYPREVAEKYLGVEGLTIHPARERIDMLEAEIRRAEATIKTARALIAALSTTTGEDRG